MNRHGFALPLALAMMVALSVMAITSLQVALADHDANRGARTAAKALYAAEAGADRTLATWQSGPWSALSPGDSAATAWTSLPDGSQYQSVVLRVDDGGSDPLFRVLTEGRPSRGSTARRVLLTMVEGGAGAALVNDGAARIRGRLRLRGTKPKRNDPPQPPMIDGRDHIPAVWSGFCPAVAAPVSGVLIEEERDLQLYSEATIEGSPPTDEVGRMTEADVRMLGGTTWDALVARADLVFDRDQRFRNEIGPSASDGDCDTSDPENWGAPGNPGSVCWGYLPIIHVDGDLRVDRAGQGQGILLVDGDITFNRDFEFYGLVVATGKILLRRGSSVSGAVIAGGGRNGNARSELREGSRIRYSSCAVARTSTGLGGARFLEGRHWFEMP